MRQTSTEVPKYMERLPNGTYKVNFNKKWKPTPKQQEIDKFTANQRLQIGGIRSGKTAGTIMHDIEHGLLRYPKANMLVIRKTFAELRTGPIEDFREHCPPELYDWHDTRMEATFVNDSRIKFGHCSRGKEEDVQQYLGSAFPYIVVDECAQFSGDVWEILLSRNTINPECEPDKTQPCGGCGDPLKCGYACLPIPHISGCTNPFGPYWTSFYKPLFYESKPASEPEDAYRDPLTGAYWVGLGTEYGEPVCVYDPRDYQMVHSTVLDNPHALKRDPGLIQRLNKLSPKRRDLMLNGNMDGSSGQYFENAWDSDSDVIDLKSDPEAIIWEPWQPVFGGWDWGLSSSWNALYFFTLAKVRTKFASKDRPGEFYYDYKRKIVCFKEYLTQNKLARELAEWVSSTLKYPNGQAIEKIHSIAFSHEKFSRSVEEHSPADTVSNELLSYGLPPVTRGTTNRIGRASLMFQKLAQRELVITSECTGIIGAIPDLMFNPDLPLDVLKAKGRADDCYDGFSLGLYGFFNPMEKPTNLREQERINRLSLSNPMMAHFEKWGNTIKRQNAKTAPRHRQLWKDRLNSGG